MAPWASRKHSFLLRKTSNIIRLKFSGDVDFCLLSVEGAQMIRIRSHPYLLEGKIVCQFLPLSSYIFTKKLVFLYHKLCFKTVIHSELSQATDWNHMYISIIINSLIFQIKHNYISITVKRTKTPKLIIFFWWQIQISFFREETLVWQPLFSP